MIWRRCCVIARARHADLFAEMQAKGYRAVSDRRGQVVRRPTSTPPLAKNEKHDVDVVVDRLKVRADMGQRLAESFEAARAGMPKAAPLRGNGHARKSICFRPSLPARCAATRCRSWSRACSLQLAAWAPALRAMVWGMESLSIRSAWWPSPVLSLASGAVKGWDRRNQLLPIP